MELVPVSVNEIPKGRKGSSETREFLQAFLNSEHDGAVVNLHEGENASNVRQKLLSAIDRNRFPIRVTSETKDEVVTLYIQKDESVLPEIDERIAKRAKAREEAKAAKAAEAPADADPVEGDASEVTEAPKGRRGRQTVDA